MTSRGWKISAIALVLGGFMPVPALQKALAQTLRAVPTSEGKNTESKPSDSKASKTGKSSAFGNFGTSKEPVRIDAASLQVLDKEQKAIYAGDVVAIQGQTTLRCSKLTIYYTQTKSKDEKSADAKDVKTPAPGGTPATPTAGGSSIKTLDCSGPVSVVSSTQTATGDHGLFEADKETVTLTGNVVLADCDNVQRGDKLVYSTKTGIANVTNTGSRRVQGVFTPGTDDKDSGTKKTSCRDIAKNKEKIESRKTETGKTETGRTETGRTMPGTPVKN